MKEWLVFFLKKKKNKNYQPVMFSKGEEGAR